MSRCYYFSNNPQLIFKYDGSNIVTYNKDLGPGEENKKIVPFPLEIINHLVTLGFIVENKIDCDDSIQP